MSESDSLSDDHLSWAQTFTGLDLGAGSQRDEPVQSVGSQPFEAAAPGGSADQADPIEKVASTIGGLVDDAEATVKELAGGLESAVGALGQTIENATSGAAAENAGSGAATENAGSGAATPTTDPPAGPCTEQPSITDSSPVPTTINADSVVDFVNAVNAALGGNAHCLCDVGFKPDTDTATGKVTKANVTVETKIVRPRLGMTRAKGAEKALIDKAAGLIKTHEENHRSIVRTVYAPFPCALVGLSTQKDLDAQMNAFDKKHTEAQDKLDNASGKLEIVMTNGVATDVRLVPR